jgi:DNA modification methylase
MSINRLILGDNLEILKNIDSETIDLIYLDPPFFSNRNYEVIWGDAGEIRSFEDRWSGGIDQYIRWLKERVEQMHRILKPTGSIFLHCDWHANTYIRVYILDKIFGYDNFKNEIIWCYNGPANSTIAFPQKHDTIFRYVKSDNFVFNKDEILIPYNEATLKRRSYAETKKKGIAFKGKNIEEYSKGRLPFDWWDGIHAGGQMSIKERIGYPTQKPEALLERIIRCASNEGDTVLDPFMGGGTTIVVADQLKRKWIGIDQSVQAVKVTEMRMHKQNYSNLFAASFTVQLHKYDYDTLRHGDALEFESWIVQQFGGTSNTKQRNDFGLDGKMPDGTPIQVKRSDNIGRNVIDNFFAAIQRSDKKLFDKNIADKKPVGYVIAFSFGKGAIQEVARLQNEENIIIKLINVEDIVPIAKKPMIKVEINELSNQDTRHSALDAESPANNKVIAGQARNDEQSGSRLIEFTALGQSEAGIEFYSWDFNYSLPLEGAGGGGFKADIIRDLEGKQTLKLKAGLHNIAVKVVDNDGLESIEIIKLKVNGEVKRQ